MTAESTIYQELINARQNPDEMMEAMVGHFRTERRPIELFEALKMNIRHRLGLPLIAAEDEPSKPEDGGKTTRIRAA